MTTKIKQIEEEALQSIKVTVTPSIKTINSSDEKFIKLAVDFAGELATEVVNLKEKAVREALVNLGWIPPERLHALQEQVDVEALREAVQFLETNLACIVHRKDFESDKVEAENISTISTWQVYDAAQALLDLMGGDDA